MLPEKQPSTLVVAALVFASIVVPLLSTQWFSSMKVNMVTALALLAALMLQYKAVLSVIAHGLQKPMIRVGVIGLLCCSVAWHYFHALPTFPAQLLLYLAVLLVAVSFFRHSTTCHSFLYWIAITKITIVVILSTVATICIYMDPALTASPNTAMLGLPVYRNIRHFNYDLFFAVCLTLYLISSSKSFAATLSGAAIIGLFGYVTLLSGGRAGLLFCFFVFLLHIVFQKKRAMWNTLFLGVAFCIGVLIASFVIDDAYFNQRISSSFSSRVDSGRLELWRELLTTTARSAASVLFGYGPGAISIMGQSSVAIHVVQAHNVFVQLLYEFGVLGVGIAAVVVVRPIAYAARLLSGKSNQPSTISLSASALALFLYALVDGIYFHAAPLFLALTVNFAVVSSYKKLRSAPAAA
jgi:hypothetical protein